VDQDSEALRVSLDELAGICRRWKVTELALFGSAVRPDFSPDSDVDVLVSFSPDAGHSLFDLIDLQEALERLFGRKVDLVERRALLNPFVRHEVTRTARVVYAA
jgi:predicted nucleotidyltransferase